MNPASPHVSRRWLRPAVSIGSLAAMLLATSLSAAESTTPDSASVDIPIVSVDAAIQKELVSLDRLLETNPKLEETLRNNVDKLTEQTFRAQNPEVDALLKRQPGLVRALRTERHYFVHRAVARLARSKVTRQDAVALDEFLTAHPDIAKALQRRPGQIVEGEFLIAHPALANFFETHPALSSILLKRSEKAKSGTPKGEKAKGGEKKK